LQAKNSVSNVRRLLGYFAGIALLVLFIATAWPVLILPFVYILPYLQTEPFLVRLMWSAVLYAIVWGGWFFVTTQKQKQSVFLLVRGWKNKLGATLGMAMFIGSSAFFNANTFGTLVKMFPSEYYIATFEVQEAVSFGSKHKSIDLKLETNLGGKVYYLTLAKKLFDYPKISTGDKMILKGQQNIFGVYVEDFEIITKGEFK
jgi:hypothetical protein